MPDCKDDLLFPVKQGLLKLIKYFVRMATSTPANPTSGVSSGVPKAAVPPNQPIQHGVTRPLSMAEPTAKDLELTEALQKILREANFFESDEEGERREIVLGHLNQLVMKFVKQIARKKGYPEELVRETAGKIFTFGSYRLGVHSKGADIDTLCVAPQHVDRNDFFTTFYEILQNEKEVEDLVAVPEAFVPVMNLKLSGISIDLVFARLPVNSITDEVNLLDVNILKNLDEKCILSLNGSRTTDEILRLIPKIETFHTALRCIKLWAKQRGLYSNAMGYFGGVACAILTARICQLYPNASAAFLVSRFFYVYKQWTWPQPVYLKEIEDHPHLNMKIWNPRINMVDRQHRMPLITPAYPSMCSTHNVSASTLKMIQTEFERGFVITSKIYNEGGSWSELFAPSDFFSKFRYFIQVIAVSENEENQRLWAGFIEAKLRHLVIKLELEPDVDWAPPYCEGFEAPPTATLEQAYKAHWFDEPGTLSPSNPSLDKLSLPLESTDEKPPTKFYSTAFYLGIGIAKVDASQTQQRTGPRRLLLDRPIGDFKSFVAGWDKVSSDMLVHVRDIKRVSLPTYIFPADQRPRVSTPARSPAVTPRRGSEDASSLPASDLGKRSRPLK
jgi:poly(A) polymerase